MWSVINKLCNFQKNSIAVPALVSSAYRMPILLYTCGHILQLNLLPTRFDGCFGTFFASFAFCENLFVLRKLLLSSFIITTVLHLLTSIMYNLLS